MVTLSGTGTTGSGSASLSTLNLQQRNSGRVERRRLFARVNCSGARRRAGSEPRKQQFGGNSPWHCDSASECDQRKLHGQRVSVETAQTATITASVGTVSKDFTLQLNAAIPALSINATSVAFGDVVVNTSATQSVTLTSTGTAPVTINGTTVTGSGFTLQGAVFPATLSPGQETTLNIVFDPTAVGAVTGQLSITSNSSTNGAAAIGLSGTAMSASVVAVDVTPANASAKTRTTQQFAAAVTGSSDTAVTWTVSGMGCSETSCGTISSTGLYTAPATVPSPAIVIINATSVSDPSKSASGTVTIVSSSGATYYLAPAANGGNDSNSGLSPNAPWLSPHHAVNCGDVIIAAASTAYLPNNFNAGNWGVVTCAAGNNVAWLSCATFDGCKIINSASGWTAGIGIDRSYWGVQGWEVTINSGDSNGSCFVAYPGYGVEIHHIIFANDIANGCYASGFTTSNSSSTVSVDYLALIGNIAYDTAKGSTYCYSGITIHNPVQSDALPGTHIYVAGNFTFGNVDGNPCQGGLPTDGEGIIIDTLDTYTGLAVPYAQQVVVDNNISVANGAMGLLVEHNELGTPPFARVYFKHNTAWGNNSGAYGTSGEIEVQSALNTEVYLNLAATNAATGAAGDPIYAYYIANSPTSTVLAYQDWGYAVTGTATGTYNSSGFTFGPNNTFGTNPQFANPTAPGAPNCGASSNTVDCMATVIANFTPTNSAAKAYGYQVPSTSSTYDPLFPQWLCNVNLPAGLVTMGCQSEP